VTPESVLSLKCSQSLLDHRATEGAEMNIITNKTYTDCANT